MTPTSFIAAISPAARNAAARFKVPASVTVAQAALESGWGAHAPGHNLFGIKADSAWKGETTIQATHEWNGHQMVEIQAAFRAYPDWQGSIDDHALFLASNPRYMSAFAFADGAKFALAIAKAGYATDPQYAAKLQSIMAAHGLYALDEPAPSAQERG
ncbi:flagellar protein FlgJ [Dyella jiangningensis]|uniref:glycoside hydrolase family 73 protein n=1 Tax=Dyella sp. AtDHG13 TaxID=1938897 RepID=UPI0008886898|nr:glucosaminidase domain-containing protein [Dyella sp. AtDHG13]PXV60674.1 flagellar protein FlgJ [Dyella sp. AtDHG13]SDJ54653.1 flagellar protein FlgJ [Dyella jiangningensis]